MPDRTRSLAGIAIAVALGAGVAALGRVPYGATHGDDALLRLSWRARGERVEECRKLSQAEVEALPAHMRRTEVCEGRVLPYVLILRVDGREILHDTIHGAGAREDRPLYVFREIPVQPGTHRVGVRFVREQRPEGRGAEAREEDHPPGEAHDALATPARLHLDTTEHLRPGDVGLVTYDPDRRTLLLRTPRDRP